MALDDFITEDQEPEYHENSTLDKARLHEERLCPSCGNEGEHLRGPEWKCTAPSDECETLTWFHTSYELSNA